MKCHRGNLLISQQCVIKVKCLTLKDYSRIGSLKDFICIVMQIYIFRIFHLILLTSSFSGRFA